MIEPAHKLHLLRDGELIDAEIRSIAPGFGPYCGGFGLELSYHGCRHRAYGLDRIEAWSALRSALAVEGIVLNLPKARVAALA